LRPGIALIAVLLTGTTGYRLIGGPRYSLLDCLYMTVITISTIGYGEIIDLSRSPFGRVFTMFIAFTGIGLLAFILSNATVFLLQGELRDVFRRRKMEKIIEKYKEHYIVCGVEGVGSYIVHELLSTKRQCVIIDIDRTKIEKILEEYAGQVYIEGDATDSDILSRAGILLARGVFAVVGDDNQNLVICLTAKQLNPQVRVVSRCSNIKNIDKIKKAGADAVVSPTSIGGLRMVSEMVRPAVVSFLDIMLRDREKNLRVEEIPVPQSFAGKSISSLNLKKYPSILLLAIKTKGDWIYNPPEEYVIQPDNTFIVLTTPEARAQLEEFLSNKSSGDSGRE
jgi:voltage-gated potassium channel